MNHCKFSYPSGILCYENEYLDADGFCISHCKVGLAAWQEMRMMSDLNRLTPEMVGKICDKQHPHNVEFHGMPPRNKSTHQGNGAHRGAFAFTLTKSPDDQLTEFDMIKSVRKVMSQKSCPVSRYAWYLEYGDNETKTHPHIHGLYETETQGRIEAKHWKRAWPIWDEKTKLGRGFRGGYHRPVRSEEGYKDYIKKDAGKNEWYNLEDQPTDITDS